MQKNLWSLSQIVRDGRSVHHCSGLKSQLEFRERLVSELTGPLSSDNNLINKDAQRIIPG